MIDDGKIEIGKKRYFVHDSIPGYAVTGYPHHIDEEGLFLKPGIGIQMTISRDSADGDFRGLFGESLMPGMLVHVPAQCETYADFEVHKIMATETIKRICGRETIAFKEYLKQSKIL